MQIMSNDTASEYLVYLTGVASEQPPGTYRTASMHETCFSDLDNLRIGSTGYVYCHQGCCEHALYFKDIRRIHPDDPQQASDYPVQTFQVITVPIVLSHL